MTPKEKVLNVMKQKAAPMRSGEIAEAAGLDKKEVDKAMKELKTDGSIFSPKVCFWQAK
jgi:DNA-binding Lrp family transcriptional regulator